MSGIRIALVQTHPLFRASLRSLLDDEPDFCVVGMTDDAGDALRVAEEGAVDVVIFEAGMTGSNPTEAVKGLSQARPETKTVFISLTENEDALFECMESGAAGFLSRDADGAELVGAIRLVARGGKYLAEPALSRFVDGWKTRRSGAGEPPSGLTTRESEVLKLLAEGNSVRICAGLLNVSAKTVEAHKFNLMRKLGIHNKVQLVRYAYEKKIVRLVALAS